MRLGIVAVGQECYALSWRWCGGVRLGDTNGLHAGGEGLGRREGWERWPGNEGGGRRGRLQCVRKWLLEPQHWCDRSGVCVCMCVCACVWKREAGVCHVWLRGERFAIIKAPLKRPQTRASRGTIGCFGAREGEGLGREEGERKGEKREEKGGKRGERVNTFGWPFFLASLSLSPLSPRPLLTCVPCSSASDPSPGERGRTRERGGEERERLSEAAFTGVTFSLATTTTMRGARAFPCRLRPPLLSARKLSGRKRLLRC